MNRNVGIEVSVIIPGSLAGQQDPAAAATLGGGSGKD